MFTAMLVLAAVSGDPGAERVASATPPGNREASLALGFGFPNYGGYYVNPFGFTAEPRFRWAFGSQEWEWLVGIGGRFTISPPRRYYDQSLVPFSWAGGLDTGVRWLPAGMSARFGFDAWVGYGERDLGSIGGQHRGFLVAMGPVTELPVLSWLRLGLELRTTFYFAQTTNSDHTPVVALTPALMGSARF